MKNIPVTQWCAHFIREQVQEGDLCIDATMGNGHDTLLLSRLCGESGRVLAFDIQEAALTRTKERLLNAGAPCNYTLLLDSHERMERYAEKGSVSCIVFNFGYLPGGDHEKATRKDSSVAALSQALTLLKRGGLLSLCIYSGGDTGFEERNAVLQWLRTLDPAGYLAIRCDYFNRPNHPPIPAMVIKL